MSTGQSGPWRGAPFGLATTPKRRFPVEQRPSPARDRWCRRDDSYQLVKALPSDPLLARIINIVDMEILVSSMLRAQGFNVTAGVLSVHVDRVVKVDFHPPNILLYTELDIEQGFAYNENLYVNPRCRHRGIGARLLAAHEEICRELKLTILINNNRNPAFWKRQGYRRQNPFWRMLLARRLGVDFLGQSMYKKV